MLPFPENFARIHEGEESLRHRSVEAIEGSDALSMHAAVIEPVISLANHLIHRDEHKDEDDLIIRLLGIRTTNGILTSLNLLLAGYYQSSALMQRDVVETLFLLEYFSIASDRIGRWRDGSGKVRREEFSPIAVRKALDEHHKHDGQKRAAAYKLYSELAAHPHPKGFAMLRDENSKFQWGPFFDDKGLEATLTELARHSVMFGEVFASFHTLVSRADRELQFAAFIQKLEWFERFFERAYDRAEVAGIRAAIDRLPMDDVPISANVSRG